MSYFDDLSYGITSFNKYHNIETMDMISFYDEDEIMALTEMECKE